MAPYMYTKIDNNGPFNLLNAQFKLANAAKYTETTAAGETERTFYVAPYSMFTDITSAPDAVSINATPTGNPYISKFAACAQPMNPLKTGASILWVLSPGYNIDAVAGNSSYRYSMTSWIDPNNAQFNPKQLRIGADVYSQARHYANFPAPPASWAQITHNKFIK